jgi:hypothetical protein
VDEMSVSMPQGTSTEPLGHVDLLSAADVRQLVQTPGPCVSMFLPTARFGPETLSGPARLRELVAQASGLLSEHGVDQKQAEELLAPARELMGNEPFWQTQSDGLAVYSAPGHSAHYRVPIAFQEEAAVGEAYRIRPLLPMVTADGVFYILALSQKSVRVLQATRQTVGEMDLVGMPRSLEEAIPQEEMQRYGQAHSTGRTSASFHGQGNEADYDKAALERFFRAVDAPLTATLGNGTAPLVLACVGYYLPIYSQVSRYPHVWERAVEGNPEARSPAQLHDAAWPLVADHFAAREQRYLDRYREQAGTGRTVTGTDEVLAAARDGRVDTLIAEAVANGSHELDRAIAETLRHDGKVVSLEEADLGGEPAALLRY